MRFALLACLSSVLISCTDFEDDCMGCEDEGSFLDYDISADAIFNRLEVRLDGQLAAQPVFFEGVSRYHYEHVDVLVTLYDDVAITAFVADEPIAGASVVPQYQHDGLVHIAKGNVVLHPLAGN